MRSFLFDQDGDPRGIEGGTRCLITLKEPIMLKDGRMYKFIIACCNFSRGTDLYLGSERSPNCICITDRENKVLSYQQCNKIVKPENGENIYVFPS